MASVEPQITLYSYFRSSCAARVRTAAHLKGIPLTYRYVHLVKGEQLADDYVSTINPCGTVPTLVLPSRDGKDDIIIRQSVAILEFFEEYFPDRTSLLPPMSDPIQRARVRELVNIISNDTQPPTNLHMLKRVKSLGGEAETWAKELMYRGLRAYEELAKTYAGVYSVGDDVTMADVVLAPAIEGAIRWGVDVDDLPTVSRIYGTIRAHPAFEKGDWRHQPDTPAEFRR